MKRTLHHNVVIYGRTFGRTFRHYGLDYFITNLLLSLFWKNFQNRSTVGKVMEKN